MLTRVGTVPRFSAKAELDTAADLAKALKDIVTEVQQCSLRFCRSCSSLGAAL